jgi:signal transduction histidine kinase
VRAEFLSGLSHDMRSPLGVVSEALAALRSDFEGDLTDEHRVLVGLADRGLLRLGRLADLISVAAALDAGAIELTRHPVDLGQLVLGAVDAAAALEPRRGVELACELPAGPIPARVDVGRLTRAVAEVVINALRHARSRALVRLERAGGEARIAIEDDGQGVPLERRASLFRRFVPRPARSGLGLGLSIAHDLCAAHGGAISLEASTLPPGRPGTTGARFTLSIPLTQETP